MESFNLRQGELLRQVLLRFSEDAAGVREDISAIAHTPDGNLWLASDELTTIERLSPVSPREYSHHQQFAVGDYIDLQDTQSEIDIEGMDFANGYLWLVGSHSTKRKRPKGKNAQKDIQRLLEITTDLNRYLLARIPLVDGKPVAQDPCSGRFSASLHQPRAEQSQLTEALLADEHIGPFLHMRLPSKDNGFDIEALAVRESNLAANSDEPTRTHLFLGLRGPVLRGMAIILEIEVVACEKTGLRLAPIKTKSEKTKSEKTKSEKNRLYRKHFVDLNGLGIRDLCFQGEDLIILAGPTMQLSSMMQVFRWKGAIAHPLDTLEDMPDDTLWLQSSDVLTKQFELPWIVGADNAEGLSLLPSEVNASQSELMMPELMMSELMVVYDSPSERRLLQAGAIWADVCYLSGEV